MYQIGDIVKLVSVRPNGWNSLGRMDEYLGNVVQITGITGNNFIFPASAHWSFQLTDIERIATEEEVKKIKRDLNKEREALKNKYKDLIFLMEDVEQIANQVFGEDRVDVVGTNLNYQVTIHFPQIKISNSENNEHNITDLYVRLSVNTSKKQLIEYFKSNISMSGMRGSVSIKERESNYLHSHLPRSNPGTVFQNFCLGSSVFSTLLTTLKIEMTEDSWYLLLYSLENYVSWESLEGGPHNKIGELSYSKQVGESILKKELTKFIKEIPLTLIEISEEGVGTIENHPEFYNFINERSKIKELCSYTKEKIEELIKAYTPKETISWKEEQRKMTIYNVQEENPKNISRELVKKYSDITKKYSEKFIKKYLYECAKQTNYKKVFG